MSGNYSDYSNLNHDFLKISVLFANMDTCKFIHDFSPQMNMPNIVFVCLSNVGLKMN